MKNSIDNLSLILQALSLSILFQDYNNVDLMQELRQQDENYLKKITEQNNKIITILEGGIYERERNVAQTKRNN